MRNAEAFIDWISANPDAGDVIPGADGARKVRWSRSGMGKRGGVRVIYFHLTADEIVLLVMVYAKAAQANVKPKDETGGRSHEDIEEDGREQGGPCNRRRCGACATGAA